MGVAVAVMVTVGVMGVGVLVAVTVPASAGDSVTTGVPVGVEGGVVVRAAISVGAAVVGGGVVAMGAGAGVGLMIGHRYVTKANKHSNSRRIDRSSTKKTRKALDEFLQRSLSVLIGSTSRRLGRTN